MYLLCKEGLGHQNRLPTVCLPQHSEGRLRAAGGGNNGVQAITEEAALWRSLNSDESLASSHPCPRPPCTHWLWEDRGSLWQAFSSSPFFLQDNLPLIVLQVHGPHFLLLLGCQLRLTLRGCCCRITKRHLLLPTTTMSFFSQVENPTGLGQGQVKASYPQATSSQMYNSYHNSYHLVVPGRNISVHNSHSEQGTRLLTSTGNNLRYSAKHF